MNAFPIREVVETLESVYGRIPDEPRFDPMSELVSCVLSQHTTDAKSFPTFFELRKRYPDWQEMVDAGQERIAETIKPVGLSNQKSKTIFLALQEIHRRTGAYSLEVLRAMPPLEARDWLTSLPGVGPKTASIVLCFAFGMPLLPVDTHVFRVAWRLGLIEKKIGEAKAHDMLLRVVPGDLAFRLHMAFIQHGRATCKSPRPLCNQCSVTEYCAYWKSTNGKESGAV